METAGEIMPVIIEFVGAGGAGKSHVCRAVVSRFEQQYKIKPSSIVIANHYSVGIGTLISFAIRNPRSVATVIFFARMLKRLPLYHRLETAVEILIYLIRRDVIFPKKTLILFDQGIMQKLRVLERTTGGEVRADRMPDRCQSLFFGKLDKLVIVDADGEIVMQRRAQRKKFELNDPDFVQNEIKRIQGSMQCTRRDAEFVKNQWGVAVYSYFNLSDDKTDEVIDFIRQSPQKIKSIANPD